MNDLDAREAQILGKPQRIDALGPDQFDAEATALVLNLRASLGLTTEAGMPAVFGLMLKHPGLFRCQMEMGAQLFKGSIPPRERELAVLRCGWLCRAPYEWGEHVATARRLGISTEEIERVTDGSGAAGWSTHEAAILCGVEELLREQMIGDDTWGALARTWSEQQLIEFPTLVGQYVATAYLQNSLRLRLAETNRGLRER
jgi:4-carboxymuconolactone decarboxylase